jgi:hypothetical protein
MQKAQQIDQEFKEQLAKIGFERYKGAKVN